MSALLGDRANKRKFFVPNKCSSMLISFFLNATSTEYNETGTDRRRGPKGLRPPFPLIPPGALRGSRPGSQGRLSLDSDAALMR